MDPRIFAALILASTPAWAGGFVSLPSARIVEAARSAIDAKLGAARSSALVTVIGHPDDVRVRDEDVVLKPRVPVGSWPRRRVSVPVDVYVDGSVATTAVVWFALSLPSSGPGYSASYPAGTDVRKLAVSPVAYDAAAVQGVVTEFPTGAGTMRLRHAVRAGEPLRADDFEIRPDVVRGERVLVTIQSGELRLSAPAVAIESGSRGERVSVMVDGAEAAVRAEVTGKGEVQVAP